MNPSFVIARKRDGGVLSREEIAAFVTGYVGDEVADYQMSALAMAILLRGMSTAETAALTEVMLRSGTVFEWPAGGPPKVDKHSTGGVGDKVSLVLAPLLACCGVQVPMISGRGLGATGGTLDKLESIRGFRTDLSEEQIHRVTESVGCVITATTPNLVPADRKLYALRDVTATVESIPLITASIMSKKLAEGLDSLVLDVKFGSGAFMKSLEEAKALADSMVGVGTSMGVKTVALVSDMNQPLGRMAGNTLEVEESLATLADEGPEDLREITIELAAELLVMSEIDREMESARERLAERLRGGAALKKFHEMVRAQGGDLDAPRPIAPAVELSCLRSGYIVKLDTLALGRTVVELGGGRRQLGDAIDHSVGLEMLVRLGDEVEQGQPWIRLFAEPDAAARVRPLVEAAIVIEDDLAPSRHLIVERIA